MKYLLFVVILFPCLAFAATTTGGVNFQDTLGYEKPQFYPITYTESGSNVYYVDFQDANGYTACSQAQPCNTISDLSGKTGIADSAGALIYIKGTGGSLNGSNDISIIGASGNEVVFKPWDDATNAIFEGLNNIINPKKYLVFDGGPNMRIRFDNTNGDSFSSSFYITPDVGATDITNVTFYRTYFYVNGDGLWLSAWGAWTNYYIINNEFEATGASSQTAQHSIYFSQNGTSGGGDGTTGAGLYIYNNIFRDTPGEAIELRMADTGSEIVGAVISGNAFHDIGRGTCGAGWKCRSAMTLTEGNLEAFVIKNNLFWDLGENCLRVWDLNSDAKVYNNTCYQWGAENTVGDGDYCRYAFCGYSPVTSFAGNYKNNILYATGNCNGSAKSAFPSSGGTSKDYNACESGDDCGTNSQAVSGTDFLSLDEDSADFLKISATDSPYQNGTDLTSDVPDDYLGQTRSAPVSIGAMEVEAAAPEVPVGSASFTYFREWMITIGLLGLLLSAMLVKPGRKWGDA